MSGAIRYRVEAPTDTPCYVDKWYVIKETQCGYWVSKNPETDVRGRWHGKNSARPFTCATEKEAWETFLKRRRIALGYAEARVNKCRGDIYEASEALGLDVNIRLMDRGYSLATRRI